MRSIRPKISFDRQRENVLQLLRDRSNDLTSGSTIKDFAEMGAHQGGGDVFTAEYVKRHFGKPKDEENPDSEYMETLRGISHLLLEKRLRELEKTAPLLRSKVNTMYPRQGGGHRDYEWFTALAKGLALAIEERHAEREAEALSLGPKRIQVEEVERLAAELENPPELFPEKLQAAYERARERLTLSEAQQEEFVRILVAARGDREAALARLRDLRKDLYLCDLGVDLLTLLCRNDDLFVEFARARTVREEKAMEESNARIAADYEDRKARPDISEKEAAEIVADLNGISVSRVRQIAEGQRLARGEEKRRPGRPRKTG